MMHCENLFCMYGDVDGCVLREIEVDIQGMCASCIYVKLAPELLQSVRKDMRKRLHPTIDKEDLPTSPPR